MDSHVGIDGGLKDILTGSEKVRAVKAVMDSRRPRLVVGEQIPLGASLDDDFAKIVEHLKEDPCLLLVRPLDVPEDNKDWVVITWVPQAAPERATHDIKAGVFAVMAEVHPNKSAELVVAARAEVTLDAVKAKAGQVQPFAPAPEGGARPGKPKVGGQILYGEPIAVVIQALLLAMRSETEKGKRLVDTWRQEGPGALTQKDFQGMAEITGVEMAAPVLESANSAVETWLVKGENKHVPAKLAFLYERYWIETVWNEPEALSSIGLLEQMGITGHNRELNATPYDEYIQSHLKVANQLLELCDAFEKKNGIPAEEQGNVLTMKWMIEDEKKHLKFLKHEYAVNQFSSLHTYAMMLFSDLTPVRSVQDGWNYVQRLKALPALFGRACSLMAEQKKMGIIPPKFVLEKVKKQLDGILEGESGVESAPTKCVLYTAVVDKVKEAAVEAETGELMAAAEAAVKTEAAGAYRSLRTAIDIFDEVVNAEGYQDHAGVGTLPDGVNYYAYMLGHSITTGMTAEEVHQLGLDDCKEIKTELEEVIKRLALKDETLRSDASAIQKVQELRRQAKWLYPFTENEDGTRTFPQSSKDQCIQDYRDMMAGVDKLIEPLFDVQPKLACKVVPVPSHMESGTPAAFYMPGSMDGSREGAFYCNVGDMMAQWKSFMRVLMVHEGVPGHHFQIALQQEMKTLPFFRRMATFTAFAEGWALYTESLAREFKYYNTEEDGTEGYDLLGYFAANLLRASRLVVDTGLHHYGWSREKAMQFMAENTLEDPGSIAIETERYCVMPGQACSYKVGQKCILALRKKLKSDLGEAFDVRLFHRQMLLGGGVPLDMMKDIVTCVAPKRRPIVGGNWKCNPDSMAKLDSLLENINKCDTSKCDVFVCPSPLHVYHCAEKLTNGAKICPQNCNFKGTGAFTGEMAVEQIKDLKIEWCLLGHSERREYFKESDVFLATKLKYVLDAGLKCVFCIGEKLPEREKGLEATMAVCIAQLEQIKGLLDPTKVVIAYEPVWAIGTGVTATPAQAQETHAAIRKWIALNVSEYCASAIRIQYGGSATAKNAPELSACPDIDGFLVGGASLKPEFVDIVAAISAA